MSESHPVLYSYRRCPYAMRARMGLYLSGVQVEQREIEFWDKPASMLTASPKGTVPVLVLQDDSVVEESFDIMLWALSQRDTYQWLDSKGDLPSEQSALVEQCDEEFKPHLDHYKYADRFPEKSAKHYRAQGERFLQHLEDQLQENTHQAGDRYLFGAKVSLADIAIFPFIRQFAHVDKEWFAAASYPALRQWLIQLMESNYFKAIMKNRPKWEVGHVPLWLDEPDLMTKDQFRKKAQGL
ncbi:glutathione S-transferase-like protein [Hydrogenovibrio crunogenus]|uniref:Glutathione S-transferase-like protein n=1 Tax=Hydrogenovibrio crunogenus TaxID=39765 RepID=A0A4P7NXG1_9GAMM|nr:glutathione S-transferase [Hydrogenovibrio crunogenus]QBZ82326.1 glutathione S-transferase-like protein [Hydrogenovibrio crunogenus]